MIIGPKYKIARRLGSPVFEKTQTPKFALREQQRAQRSRGMGGRRKSQSSYSLQLTEKQKVRFTYGITEKQFSNYIKTVIANKSTNPGQELFEALEARLDNIVYRSGLVPTRRAARQAVSHGHITVNGVRTNIPSRKIHSKDIVQIREASKTKGIFDSLDERIKETIIPSWLSVDVAKKGITLRGAPTYVQHENNFDLSVVIQFYKR